MTDNEIISARWGECRHEKDFIPDEGIFYCVDCCKTSDFAYAPDYSNDPAAWGPELFEAIERAGLKKTFINNMETEKPYSSSGIDLAWSFIKSTPAQKARALARAIKEVER